MVDAHRVEDVLELAQVARVAVEAGDDVERAIGSRRLLARQVLEDALHHHVEAVEVAPREARRVGERDRHVSGYDALVLGGLDVGGEVVADNLGHARGRDRDHVRLVHRVGVLEALDHVREAAEDRRVLRHRARYGRDRLLEVAREVAAEVGGAALRALHERQRPLEAERREHRAERLARLARVDDDALAGEVELAVLVGLRPGADAGDLLGGGAVLELLLVRELLDVGGLAEQCVVVFRRHGRPPSLRRARRRRRTPLRACARAPTRGC